MFKMGSHDPYGHLKHRLWQFDSWLLKVRNRLDFLMCRCLVTYCWKNLDKGYHFVLNLISIGGFHTKLWASKVARVPISRTSRLQLWSFGTKWHLGGNLWPGTKNDIRGRWWLPPRPGCGESCGSVFGCGSSLHQKCANYAPTNLLFSLCMSVKVIDLLVTLPGPYPKAPNFSFFHCVHLGFTFESIKELGSVLNKKKNLLTFLSFLVAKDVLEEVQLGFLVMGHTHENIDGCFGYLSKKLKE